MNIPQIAKLIAATINENEVVCLSQVAEEAASNFNLCHQDAWTVADMVLGIIE